MPLKHVRLICFLSLALTACSPAGTKPSDHKASVTEQAPQTFVMHIDKAFIMQPIGGRNMTMGGIQLHNKGADTRLTDVSSPAFGTIEMHTMAMHEGTMRMRKVDGFDIASGETLSLERGGNHLMMFDLTDEIKAGDTVDLRFYFSTGDSTAEISVAADVLALGN